MPEIAVNSSLKSAAAVAAQDSATTSPMTILIVEDQNALRRLLALSLAGQGFTVLEAGSAVDGLAAFHRHREAIALAIIDMIMPGMSGLDLAAEMERELPGMRILYISGYGSSVAMESIGRRAPEHVLLKPFTGAEIAGRVRKLLGLDDSVAIRAGIDPLFTVAQSAFAWDRLIEGSDRLGPDSVQIVVYKDTSFGFSIAAVHAAALRAAGISYEFRASEEGAHPFGLFVAPERLPSAHNLIACVGLGADIALAA